MKGDEQRVKHSSASGRALDSAPCTHLSVHRDCQHAGGTHLAQDKPEIFTGLDMQRVPGFSGALTENCLFIFPGLLQCQLEPGPIQLHQSS